VQNSSSSLAKKVILVTGAAHRVGAAMVRSLHAEGANIALHYRYSRAAAQALADELNNQRPNSVQLFQADLANTATLPQLINEATQAWGQLDVLINNASSFYPTPIGEVNETAWDDLMASNLKAPFFLAQSAAPELTKNQGAIINIVDIHADRPLKGHSVYCMAKAGLVMMTKSLARELGPEVRVNAVAPGAILWPEGIDELGKQEIVGRTALKRSGSPEDIARAVVYLLRDAHYTTGQILAVDGGRTLSN